MHPVALFSILDHYLRRTEAQERVIGTLLGKRSDNGEIEVRSSFAVLHSETEEQVAVDMDYLKTMYDLHHKVSPKEVIVGWYACILAPLLSSYVDVDCQVLYRVEPQHILRTHPQLLRSRGGTPPGRTSGGKHRCGRGREGGRKSIHWVRTPLATAANQIPSIDGDELQVPSWCVPEARKLRLHPYPVRATIPPHRAQWPYVQCQPIWFAELMPGARVVVDLLSTTSAAPNSTTPHPVTDLEVLESSLKSVAEMLDRVISYVQQVLTGEVKGDAAVGRYLMDTLGSSTEDLEKGGFNSSLQVGRMMYENTCRHNSPRVQDTLMVSYLASLVRSQAEVSARLALVTAT